MKDIDFDELDRAVGSVLGTDADAAPKSDAPATATITPAPTRTPLVSSSDPDTKSESQSPASGSDPITSEGDTSNDDGDNTASAADSITSDESKAKPSVSPARKRGQFLDMVHPSADMRKGPSAAPIVRKKIVPLTSATQEDAPETSPIETTELVVSASPAVTNEMTPVEVPDVHVESEGSTNENAGKTDENSWPDPLDFAKDTLDTSGAAPTAEAPSDAFTPVEPQTASITEPTAVEASQTPFVTDAKVDKRPLGAFATQEDDEPGSDAPVASDDTSKQPTDDAPEFNSDVNSVESTGVPAAEKETTGFTGEAAESAAPHVEAPTETPAPATIPDSPAESTPVTPESTSSFPGASPSIPQQYKTAEPQKDDESHSLFDTEEYHQPLLPDGKKKSKKGLLIVLFLIILLIVGGVLGYFAYTMGI